MPFIIKSSKSGPRTAQVTDNNETTSSIRAEMIDMLKGLTFKIEIKLADIIDDKSSSGDETNVNVTCNLKPSMMIPPQVKQMPKAVPPPPPTAAPATLVSNPQAAPAPPKQKKERLAYKIGSEIDACCASYTDHETVYLTRSEEAIVVVSQLISGITDNLNSSPAPKSVQVGQLLLAKSSDDNTWYRAIVEAKYGTKIGVDFIDWGMKEIVEMKDLRDNVMEELSLANISPCAILANIKDSEELLIQEFALGDGLFKAQVLNYDEGNKSFGIKLLRKSED